MFRRICGASPTDIDTRLCAKSQLSRFAVASVLRPPQSKLLRERLEDQRHHFSAHADDRHVLVASVVLRSTWPQILVPAGRCRAGCRDLSLALKMPALQLIRKPSNVSNLDR